ncbi:MAG: DUF3147 family protein [Vampirovibrionia bacterium]
MSLYLVLKIIISGVLVGVVTEISKKYTIIGGLIAAMPLTTLLAILWLYFETKDLSLIGTFSRSVFFGIFPTLMFFLPAMFLFKKDNNFFVVLLICFLSFGVGAYFHHLYVK